MIKMIAFDLDGTLLRTDKSISELTKTTLKKCRDKGIKIAYATGRGSSTDELVPREMVDGRVLMNGAVAIDGEKTIHSRLIPIDSARSMLVAADKHGLKIAAEFGGVHYSNFDTSSVWNAVHNYKIVDFSTHTFDAEKINALIEKPEDVEFLERHIPENSHMMISRDALAMIMHKDATKSTALAVLAGQWGIEMSEIVAFGDDVNDIDMLSKCGIGVAMGDALDEVKAVADEECDTSDNDGIANWLMKRVL